MKKLIIFLVVFLVMLQVTAAGNYAESANTIEKVEFSTNILEKKVEITGKISSDESLHVTLLIKNPDGEIDFIDQTTSIEEGNFTFVYVPNKWIEGQYTVRIGGEGVKVPYTGSFEIKDEGIVNNTPVLEPIGNKTVEVKELLAFAIKATDADGDTLTYSTEGLPSGAVLDSATGEFQWTPSSAQSGKYTVTFIVSDGVDEVTETIIITVKKVSSGDSTPSPSKPSPEPEAEPEPGEKDYAEKNFDKEETESIINNAQNGVARFQVEEDGKEVNEVKVIITGEVIYMAEEQGIQYIEIDTGIGIVKINPSTLIKKDGTVPANIEFSIRIVDPSELSEDVRSIVGDNPVYDFNLSLDGEKIDEFSDDNIFVSMDYTLKPGDDPDKVVVYYIDDNGFLQVVTNGLYNPDTGKVEFTPNHFSMYSAAYADKTFDDVKGIEWMQGSIEALAVRDVIHGYPDGLFRPNNKVTRSEFVKMLMLAFELDDSNAVCTFNDIREGEWNYQPVATAQVLGIVNGKPDGSFGANDPILRQDMAVIIYRTAQAIGIELGDIVEKMQFSDKAEISEYALEAIEVIQKAGIIKGVGEGKFAPRENATRAEAAVIIFRLFKQVTR